MVKLNNGTVPVDTRFAALYEAYRSKKGWSHEMMADHYTGIMQHALKEVHPLLNDSRFLNGYDDNTRSQSRVQNVHNNEISPKYNYSNFV